MNVSFIIGLIVVALAMIYAILLVFNNKSKKPHNKVHFYVARDKNGELWLYLGKPVRNEESFENNIPGCVVTYGSYLFELRLNKDDYKNLKWEDEPKEVFLNLD